MAMTNPTSVFLVDSYYTKSLKSLSPDLDSENGHLKLVETGFEYVCEFEDVKIFRRRK